MASGIFLILLVLAIFPGAKLASVALGHGPDDLYPYAVGTYTLRPDGPWSWVPDTHQLSGLGFTTIQSMGGAGLDLPMLVGITLFTGTVIIVLNLLVDLFAVAVDPTISRSPRAGRRLGSPVAARSNA